MGNKEPEVESKPNVVLDRGQQLLDQWRAISNEPPAASLEKIEKEANAAVDIILEPLKDESVKELLEVIQKRRSNLHIKPEFTPTIISACQQILIFGGAGLAVVATFSGGLADLNWSTPWVKMLACLAIFYFNLIVVAALTLVWFFIQARTRYPFLYLKTLANTIPYWYYRTLSRDHSWRPVRGARGIVEANALYLADLLRFVDYHANETGKTQLRTELTQYYLLIVYQGYLDQFEMQLVHIFLFGLLGSVLAAMMMMIFIL